MVKDWWTKNMPAHVHVHEHAHTAGHGHVCVMWCVSVCVRMCVVKDLVDEDYTGDWPVSIDLLCHRRRAVAIRHPLTTDTVPSLPVPLVRGPRQSVVVRAGARALWGVDLTRCGRKASARRVGERGWRREWQWWWRWLLVQGAERVLHAGYLLELV